MRVLTVSGIFLFMLLATETVLAQPLEGDDLFLTDSTPGIVFDDTDVGGWNWVIRGRAEEFHINDEVVDQTILLANPALDSTAFGYGATAVGGNSTALGYRAKADSAYSVVLGGTKGVNNAAEYSKIGIGTTTPAEAVDVQRSAAAARFQLTSFTNTVNEAAQFVQRRAGGTPAAPTAVLNNDNLGLLSFRGYNGSVMGGSRATITAQAAGDFSGSSTPTRLIFATTPVGQTSPQQVMVITPDGKVQVNGQNLNVPDYVFEDDYQLMPLDELRTFIDSNGHLPGIAPAHEVQAKGLDLASSQLNNLQKIEELTLYTLQQQERIEQLEAQLAGNQDLQQRLAQLEQLVSQSLPKLVNN